METFQIVFPATLTHFDNKKHIAYPVRIPAGTRSLQIRLAYFPHTIDRINNLLTLTVLDPGGFRGAAHRHGNVLEGTISETSASPGFFPGVIQPGEWTVLVDTHMIMPGEPLNLDLVVTGSDQPVSSLVFSSNPTAVPAKGAGHGPGWYKGDFHAHTVHSDGSWEIADLLAFGMENLLDFVTLSDHNTVSGLPEFIGACQDGMLPICAIELTTFWGHALALGRKEWVDWRIIPGEREMTQIAAEIETQGGLFIIAHPEAIGDPYCTGCHWSYPDMRPGPAKVVEVWNSAWNSESNNDAGLELAYAWMQSGLRMVLTAGTDRHGKPYAAPEAGFNIVYAEDLSEEAILRAVRAGHLYLSNGPSLWITAQVDSQVFMTGDSCQCANGETISVQAAWENCTVNGRLDLVVDGHPFHRQAVHGSGSTNWKLRGGQARWALLTLRTTEGEMLALTNPIFFDGR